MTVSGSAGGPSADFQPSSLLALVMLFFNVRLGWWLGNPGVHGQRTFEQAFPQPSLTPELAEAVGFADDTSHYVNVQDGGGFDNLGLFEMIVRRCQVIVLIDAGADAAGTFEDFANTSRRVRLDLGVPIVIRDQMRIKPRPKEPVPGGARYCALADVDYRATDGPEAVNGVILYIKPCFYGDEPTEISSYAAGHAEFPHETTMDQSFSESQFESYRMLGVHIVRRIWGGGGEPVFPVSVQELIARTEAYLTPGT